MKNKKQIIVIPSKSVHSKAKCQWHHHRRLEHVSLQKQRVHGRVTHNPTGVPISILPLSLIETGTFIIHVHRISYTMYDSLYSRDARNTSMEAVVGCEWPASKPEKRVIACCKYPHHRNVRNRKNTSSVSDVSHKLNLGLIKAVMNISNNLQFGYAGRLLCIWAE